MSSDDDSNVRSHMTVNIQRTTKCSRCGNELGIFIKTDEFMCKSCQKQLEEEERSALKKRIHQLANKYDLEEKEVFRQILIHGINPTKEKIKPNKGAPRRSKKQKNLQKEVLRVVKAMKSGQSIFGQAKTIDELIAEIYGIDPEKKRFYTRSWQKVLRSLRSEMKNHYNGHKSKKRKHLKTCFLRILYGNSKYKHKEFELEPAVNQ